MASGAGRKQRSTTRLTTRSSKCSPNSPKDSHCPREPAQKSTPYPDPRKISTYKHSIRLFFANGQKFEFSIKRLEIHVSHFLATLCQYLILIFDLESVYVIMSRCHLRFRSQENKNGIILSFFQISHGFNKNYAVLSILYNDSSDSFFILLSL